MKGLAIRWRLTIWYGLALAVTLGLFCVAIYWLSRKALLESVDADLVQNVGILQTELPEEVSEQHLSVGQQSAATGVDVLRRAAKETFSELRLAGVSAEFRLGGRAEILLARFQSNPSDQVSGRALVSARLGIQEGRPSAVLSGYRGVRRLIPSVAGTGPVTVIVVSDTRMVEHSLVAMRDSLATLSFLGLLLGLGGGYILADRALRPIDSLGRQARLLAQARPAGSHRLHVVNEADEFGRLAAVFNGLLQRLDAALLQMRRFVADAAHQLRTPVSIVRGEAELALSRQRSATDYRDSLETIAGESVHLSRLVRGLTLLTEGETTEAPIENRLVDLDEILGDTARALRSLAEQRRVRIELENGRAIQCSGDEHLIREIVLNLVDNAIKFSVEGGRARVETAANPLATIIRVTDSAPTIPEAERGRIFERFYRGAAARASGIEGSGLGLAIVAWAAERHGGSVRVEPAISSGNVFIVELPISGAWTKNTSSGRS